MNSPQDSPDWNPLIARVLSGDSSAAEHLAEKLGVWAYNFFSRAEMSREDAEDLAQDFVVRVIARLGQFDGCNFIGWIVTIRRRLLLDHHRQRNKEVPTNPLLENDHETLPLKPSLNGHLSIAELAALAEALSQLKPDEIALIESQTGSQNVPFEQIGNELNISTNYARVRHHRAKAKLVAFLREDPRMKSWLKRH